MNTDVARKTEDRAVDYVNAALGVVLVLLPWIAGFTSATAAAWNASIVGLAIAAVAVGALVSFAEWEEWANLVLGAWAVVAPWALGFAAVASAMYSHVVVGAIVAVLAAIELWRVRNRPVSA